MLDKSEFLNNSVSMAKLMISSRIKEGDVVVDATMGNGHDTLFLARRVGLSGRVYAFDIQEQAIDNTKALLAKNNFTQNVDIIRDGHQNMNKYIKEKVKLVQFNLGYLPGSDKSLTTLPNTTIIALKKSLSLLDDLGLIILVIYPGHPDGACEKREILDFTSKLPQNEYNVFALNFINHANTPPVLVGIEKKHKKMLPLGGCPRIGFSSRTRREMKENRKRTRRTLRIFLS